MKYENLLKFYNDNKDTLVFGHLRPAKSITRNIASGLMPFISHYRVYGVTVYTEKYIARNILELDCDGSSTSRDNIRNMQELKFMTLADDYSQYHLTDRFIDFCNSGLTIREYIFQALREISKLSDITMFFNCILCTLIDGVINGDIVLYPESFRDFKASVTDRQKRYEMCENVYKIYGFKGVSNASFGTYTPNANYRIVSTCVSLGLIARNGENEYEFKKYSITPLGHTLLETINNNLK